MQVCNSVTFIHLITNTENNSVGIRKIAFIPNSSENAKEIKTVNSVKLWGRVKKIEFILWN